MAGKFGKFLLATAAVAAAVAGTYYYTTGKSILDLGTEEDEDGNPTGRSYVTLNTERIADSVKSTASDLADSAKRLSDEAVDLAKSVARDVSGRIQNAAAAEDAKEEASSGDPFMDALDEELKEVKQEEFFDDEEA